MQSLLETAYSLQHNLVDALSPSREQLHPLALASTNPLESIAQLRQRVQQTLRQLQRGLAHFPAAGGDRYLTQLKDAAASEAALLKLALPRRPHADNNNDRYRVPTPRHGGLTALRVLEQIASELDLVTFRDHEHEDDAAAPVTLSLGGKLVVVDVTASSAQSHHIERVKVAYVVRSLDKLSTLAATKLENLFATSDEEDEEDEDVREEREQARWKGIRRILSELKDLDEMAHRTGTDAFQELEKVDANLGTAFFRKKKDDDDVAEPAGASASAAAPKDRLLIQPRDSLYPIVIYHATPFAQLGSRWTRLISSSSLSRFEIMEALRGDGGQRQAGNIYAVQLELGPLLLPPESEPKPESQPTTAAKEDDDRPAGSSPLFLARLIPSGVPILPETGRVVLEALGFGSETESESGKGVGAGTRAMTGAGGEGNLQDDGRRARPVDDEDEGDDNDAAKEGGAGGGERRSRTRTRTRTRTALAWMRAALPPSTTTTSHSRSLLLRYQFPTTPSASSSSSRSSSAENTAASTGCYEASYLAFRSIPHLVAALEILARQTRLNELLRSVVDERYGAVVGPSSSVDGTALPAHGHGQGAAEKPVKPMSLDDLFTPPSADTPLAVPISVGTGTGLGPGASSSSSSTSASPPPTFSLSFPFPALEAAPPNLLGLPLSLHFSLPPLVVADNTLPSASSSSSRSSSAAAAEEEEVIITTKFVAPDEVVRSLLGGEEARRELEGRVGRVVRETGVVGLAVEEVVRTLRRAVTGMSDKPE
ncbi:hypothetical protein RHOSPDRAFT_27395 [Rhodotorula sp. JG-1b]|nr:hypothetical protein RHOSPDRAFT_27395 [Rhodotorula sp. JG-1b]